MSILLRFHREAWSVDTLGSSPLQQSCAVRLIGDNAIFFIRIIDLRLDVTGKILPVHP